MTRAPHCLVCAVEAESLSEGSCPDIDDMEDIIDPMLMRKRSGKYIAQMLVRSGFGRVSKYDVSGSWPA